VLDILDNVIAVLAGLRERQGVPVGDVIGNLGAAQDLVGTLQEPDGFSRRSPLNTQRGYRHDTPHRLIPANETILGDQAGGRTIGYDPECSECCRLGFCSWCQGACTLPTPFPDLT
jgi:hypothetical protein